MTTPSAPGSDATYTEDSLTYSSRLDEAKSQLFPPQDAQSAAAEVQEVVHRSPMLYGRDRHTWTLADLGQTIPWMGEELQPSAHEQTERGHTESRDHRKGEQHKGKPRKDEHHKREPRDRGDGI